MKIGLSPMFNARFAKVMGKEKLHTPKFDFLYKHDSKKKVKDCQKCVMNYELLYVFRSEKNM